MPVMVPAAPCPCPDAPLMLQDVTAAVLEVVDDEVAAAVVVVVVVEVDDG